MCFFFQAEDGIRDRDVTGVQTCALPISAREGLALMRRRLVNPGLEAHQRKAFARRLVLDACEDGAPDVLAARFQIGRASSRERGWCSVAGGLAYARQSGVVER